MLGSSRLGGRGTCCRGSSAVALSNWDSRSLFVILLPCSGAAARGAVAGAVQQASRRRGGRRGGSGGGGGTRGGGAGWGAHRTGERGTCSPPTPVRRPCCGCAAAAVVLWPRLLQALPAATSPVCVRVPMHLTMHATPQVDPGEHYGEDGAAAGGGDKRPTGWQSLCRIAAGRLALQPAPCRRCAAAACRLPAESCCSCLQHMHSTWRGADVARHVCVPPAAGKVVGIIKRNWRTRGYCGSLQVRAAGAARRPGGPLRPLCQLLVPAVPGVPAAAPSTLRCPCLPCTQVPTALPCLGFCRLCSRSSLPAAAPTTHSLCCSAPWSAASRTSAYRRGRCAPSLSRLSTLCLLGLQHAACQGCASSSYCLPPALAGP